MKQLIVNDEGQAFIKAMYDEHTDIDILQDGVFHVVDQIESNWVGGEPHFEISMHESLDGKPHVFYLPYNCYKIEEVEDD